MMFRQARYTFFLIAKSRGQVYVSEERLGSSRSTPIAVIAVVESWLTQSRKAQRRDVRMCGSVAPPMLSGWLSAFLDAVGCFPYSQIAMSCHLHFFYDYSYDVPLVLCSFLCSFFPLGYEDVKFIERNICGMFFNDH